MTVRHATALETVSVVVPEDAVEVFEAALAQACGTVGFFKDDFSPHWTLEGVKTQGENEAELASALALAELATGVAPTLTRHATPADGWLARTFAAFPEQLVGRRFAIRGTHLAGPPTPGRITIVLDAAIAFGSGEHGSTRGCLRALEFFAHRRPDKILDLGTGTGILAMAAAKLLHRRVLATDIDPWSVRMARENAARNGLAPRLRVLRADGFASPALRRGGFDLVFANILARPLCRMAKFLAAAVVPGGTAILAGLLDRQWRWVFAAFRRHGLFLEARLREGDWTTLVLRKGFGPKTEQYGHAEAGGAEVRFFSGFRGGGWD